MSGLPPFGTWLGKSLVEDSAGQLGYGFLTVVNLVASADRRGCAASNGSNLPRHRRKSERRRWDPNARGKGNTGKLRSAASGHDAPAIILLVLALVPGVWPGLEHHVQKAACQFENQQGYITAVLGGTHASDAATTVETGSRLSGILFGLGGVAGGCARRHGPLSGMGPDRTSGRRPPPGRTASGSLAKRCRAAWLLITSSGSRSALP